jgi:hypothetical protein
MVAPTDFTGWLPDGQRTNLDFRDTGFLLVLYGGLDGDVSGMDGARTFGGNGFRHYDRASAEAAMVYVPGCDHNRFNRTWSADDSGLLPTDLPRLHSRADHEQLMIEYVGGLFEWKLTNSGSKAALFRGFNTNSLGHPASLQWSWGAHRKPVESFENPAVAEIGARTLRATEQKKLADITISGATIAPNTTHQTRVASINPNAGAGAAVEIDVAAGQRDWSGFDLLTFRLGTWMDVTSEASINSGISPPPLTITLVDGANKSGSASEVSFTTNDLPGKPVFHQAKNLNTGATVNCTLHRLATATITLASLGVNLADVRKLQVTPGPAFGQRIFIDSFLLVTP